MAMSLYTLLAESAARHPDRPAIRFGDDAITYAAFQDKVDRLAGWLGERGVGPGQHVALFFRKSIDALVSMFALIRRGATYVPLDPAWPQDRIDLICDDAAIETWLGSAPPADVTHFRTIVSTDPRAPGATSILDACESAPDRCDPAATAEGIANVLYTSGSTGRPKGVRITTLSLLHFSQWVAETFELGPEDVIANHAPYNFDLSTLDIFATVRAGACMCPVPERLKMFPYRMARFIAEQRISVWYSVPSALMMLQLRGKLPEHDLQALRHLIFAGEVMPKPALQAIARDLPHPTCTNLYGPTETNACTWHRLTSDDLRTDEPVPIGRPITKTRIWIMDERGQPVGDGDAGELWVAGPTLTAGYHGDTEMTAQRLVPAPGGSGHAYRTGDRVRARADGVLLFEGRIDRMIKCRGHRVEPGEIEAVLARHPSIREVAVLPLPDPVFGNRIRACVAGDGAALTETELAAYCRRHLPVYMLPDVWDIRASLPRTDREKIDYQALTGIDV